MKNTIRTTLSLITCAALAAAAPCQERETSRAEARAEARANAGGPGSSRSSHSVTHRVVVVNGKKVVDERTENGKPAGGRPAGRGRPAAGKPAIPDAKEMLRGMREQLERELGRKLPLGGFDEPLPKKASRGPRSSDRSKVDVRKGNKASKRTRGRLEPRRKLR